MTKPRLELRNLECEREGRILFSSLSQAVVGGEVLQVVGPNGSGKTTLLKNLTGVTSDYQGEILWRGQDIRRHLHDYHCQLLYLGHMPAINKTLTPFENLRWLDALAAGEAKLGYTAALEKVGLAGYEDIPCYRLSAGQLRRVALARLYLSQAPLWVLDEPFTAIDVDGVEVLRRCFREHLENGGIVVVTTHQELGMDSVKRLDLLEFQRDHYE